MLIGCEVRVFGVVAHEVDWYILLGRWEGFGDGFVLDVPDEDVAAPSADGNVAVTLAVEAGRPGLSERNVLTATNGYFRCHQYLYQAFGVHL